MSSKSLGEYAEARFVVQCLEHGIIPCDPFGDNQKYDKICEAGGQMYRIQIKSTSKATKSGKFSVLAASGSKNRTIYTPEEIDILAVYIVPYDLFYLVPVGDLTSVKVYLRPTDPERDTMDKYKDNWNVLIKNC